MRFAALADVVACYPDQTLGCVALLAEARRAKILGFIGGTAAGAEIPRRIIQYYHADNPPADMVALAATWRRHNPDFEIRFYSRGTAAEYLTHHFGTLGSSALRAAHEPSMQADLIRLAVVSHEGGWAIDIDNRCLAPIESLGEAARGFVCHQDSIGAVGSSFLGAAAGHPVILQAFDSAIQALGRGDADIRWLATGAGLLSRTLAGRLAASASDPVAALDDVRVLSRAELAGVVAVGCAASYKNAPPPSRRTPSARPAPKRLGRAG